MAPSRNVPADRSEQTPRAEHFPQLAELASAIAGDGTPIRPGSLVEVDRQGSGRRHSALRVRDNEPRVVNDINGAFFRKGGVEFRPGDVVFFEGEAGSEWTPGVLGRSHSDQEWGVRVCGRQVDLRGRLFLHETDLYLTEDARFVPLTSIQKAAGFTYLKLLPRHADHHPHSLVPLPHAQYPLPNPNPAEDRSLSVLRPPAVDLYAGGDGMLFGVNQHFHVQHAVERDDAAHATFRDNFPAVNIHHCTVGDFTQSPSRRPEPGSVALLVAGPPCQSFTLANRVRKLNDASNAEVFTVLVEVARLKPDVFLLENVPGICNPFQQGGRTVNILAQVVQKLVGELGYQVRLGKINSRDYGSPQDRHRIFVLAGRSGLPLPSWPTATHLNPKPSTLSFMVGGETVVLGSKATGPRRAVTARDAIGDMPNAAGGIAFDYEHLDSLTLPSGAVGVPDGTQYRRSPMTSYQQAARGAEVGVRDHFTQHPPASVVELVLSAPRADTPRTGRGANLRCDPHGAVPTLQGNPFPGGNSTLTIHWNAHRVLSVAERRRVQGLPDSYVLRGSAKDKDTMLGNMVDVHVARSLAEHIKSEVFAPSWRDWGRPASDEFWRMWRVAHPT
ncbi:hypothetical protein CspeluHIS016_0205330 [Cutaneotrichosporon spelunceum]|uniref:DNA (cytosine-5-)-methyltransferase n=1 Tax=Cutaneotrichosporon spelunceum TaxID=1672016 RepID=A0AAD3YB32_9TREE|nr:hypothetical protein CspeluHIS016_0205330 [Cutaneotrichosporon spelunceum]